ncbi:hypothetical protein F5Y06DRAFT_86224 [Hypoxylon sp. FL0890]|nr:hypothetical protein F5Y06DRAFT_86224 [Hypoxylon sp. FL0890]
MPPVERDAPADRHLRHQHSSSIGAIVPMWDSSDPERAPPPLPMHPQSPSVSTSRAGTSVAIQNAHAALTEKARENSLVPSLAKRMNDTSPERALVQRPSPHKRMQSLQPGSVRDLSLMIEGSRDRDSTNSTPRGSPEKDRSTRPSTPVRGRDHDRESRSAERENTAPGTPTPMPPNLNPMARPSARRPPQSILGENTPPQSATMLALQNMPSSSSREIESPLGNVTNNSIPTMKPHPATEFLSNQLITLTNIATALQKEMSQLSRRSRDNATDLMSLKEATHARDEDIRKSLRELASNVNVDSSRYHRDTYTGGMYLDNKPFNVSPGSKTPRPISLPRIPSPNSFAASIDRESILSTPSLVGGESPATMALLEKIIREMGTKDGQDTIVGRLSELADRLAGMASADKVEELIHHLKVSSEHSMSPPMGGSSDKARTLSFSSDDSGSKISGVVNHRVEKILNGKDNRRPSTTATTRVNEVLNDDVIKIIRSVKDSVAQGGGMTAEVKALVRELRGEVLGMGRDIMRRLDDPHVKSPSLSSSKSETASRAELARIVEEGLEQIRVYMAQRLRDHRLVSSEEEKPAIDYQEIYNALRTALGDVEATRSHEPKLSRDDVIEAVKDAWENYKPEIEIQQIGLERDEVLECLKEGLEQYAPRQEAPQYATRDEVFEAIVEGLKHYVPPQVDTPASLTRDEVIDAVRECLEDFEFPIAPAANDLTRDDVLEAVKEGINSTTSTALVPHGSPNVEIMERLHDIMQYMREEFKAVSEEAKQNVAANGRDTEQVLDATRDGIDQLRTQIEGYVDKAMGASSHEELMTNLVNGFEQLRVHMDEFVEKISGTSGQEELMTSIAENLEQLRTHIESPSDKSPSAPDQEELMANIASNFEQLRTHMEGYVDKVSGVSNQEELMSNVVSSFDIFKEEVSELVAKASDGSRDIIRQEIESLRDTVNSSLVPHVPQMSDNRDVLEAIRDSIERIRGELLRPHAGTTDILDALHEGFSDLRISIEKVGNKPADLTANDEILDALKCGLDDVRTNIDSLRDNSQERAVATIPSADAQPSDALIPADLVKHDDIKNLEVLMTQLRVKMDSMEIPQPVPAAGGLSKDDLAEMEEMLRNGLSKEDLNEMEEMLRSMQESMAGRSASKDGEPPANPEDAATKEDVQAIETILRNTKSRLDDLIDGEQAVRKDHVDALEALVLETKDSLATLAGQLETVSRKEDLLSVESLVTQITTGLEEAKERAEKSLEDPEKVTKTHVEAVVAAVFNVKSTIEEMLKSDIATLPSKDDIKNLEDIVKELKENTTTHAESNAKAFEEQKAETTGMDERVTEVKAFLEEFQALVKEKLENGGNAVESLGKILEGLSETVHKNADVGSNLKEMFELVKSEFEESKASVVGAKLDTDEKIKETTEALGSKLEVKIGELVTKYDEFQLVMEDRTKTSEERDEEMKAAMVNTNTISEELKVLIDTLGSTVTDSLEKMEEASKTVFEKVETLYGKTEENHAEGKTEHQMTRDHVQQAISAVEGLQGHVGDYQPKILDSIKEVLLVVGQHYEHSKNSESGILQKIEDAKPEPLMLPPPPEKYDDSVVQSKLDKLDGEMLSMREKLESEMHSKIDRLVDHTHTAEKAYAQLYTLDMVHQQVVKTAADISEFLSSQKQRIEQEYEDREKTLQEATIQLERQKAERDEVEVNLVYLRDEEAQLRASILALRNEQESLIRQRTRLTGDVSSLETALHLRREELQAMDARAEGLERRILEGVLDHSRALLMTKSTFKGREAMSRKRVPGARSSLGPTDDLNSTPKQSKPRAGVNMAVNSGRASLVPPNPASAGRRILSLSQITNNVPTGGIKRSQSVRSPAGAALRKSSWAPGRNGARKGYGDLEMDKENVDVVRESDEEAREDSPAPESEPDTPTQVEDETVRIGTPGNDETPVAEKPADEEGEDDATEIPPETEEGDPADDGEEIEEPGSEADTMRRSSLGTTVITGAETESGYTSEDQGQSDWTESAVGGDSVASESIAGEEDVVVV